MSDPTARDWLAQQLATLAATPPHERQHLLELIACECGHLHAKGRLGSLTREVLLQQVERFGLDAGPVLEAWTRGQTEVPPELAPLNRSEGARNAAEAGAEPVLVCMGDVEAEEVSWLWPPYLPAGKLVMVEGDPGCGKTWLALTLAAIVTRGWPFPTVGDREAVAPAPGIALYMTAEDGLGDTLRPRLDAAGADCDRVHVLDAAQETDPETGRVRRRPFNLQDVATLRLALERLRPALVIVDPVQGFTGPGVDMNKANDVRSVLAPLARLAQEFGVCIVLIRHLTKGNRDKASYRGLGSVDFLAAARSALLVGEDRRPGMEGRRAFVHLKSSLAPRGPAMAFEIRSGRMEWLGESDITAADLTAPDARPPSKLDQAREFLTKALEGSGGRPQAEVEDAAKAAGIASGTLRRAADALRVQRRKQPGVKDGPWLWSLPQDPEVEDAHVL